MDAVLLGIPLLLVTGVLYLAATRRHGILVVLSWLLVPSLIGFAGAWATWMFMNAVGVGHLPCGHEDYFCDKWPPMAIAHLLLLLLAVAGPSVVTVLWLRERRKRRQDPAVARMAAANTTTDASPPA